MEEFNHESYTSAQVGLESQTTVFVMERSFGDRDLLDLYSDYVVEKVREDMKKRNSQYSDSD